MRPTAQTDQSSCRRGPGVSGVAPLRALALAAYRGLRWWFDLADADRVQSDHRTSWPGMDRSLLAPHDHGALCRRQINSPFRSIQSERLA